MKLTSTKLRFESDKEIAQLVENTIKRIARKADKEFSKSHKDYSAESQPSEVFDVRGRGMNVSVEVGREGQEYAWVNFGVSPHSIDGDMYYQQGFSPKVQHGIIASQSGGKFGAYNENAITHVDHPGIEPQEYDNLILEELESYIDDQIDTLADDIADGFIY